MTGVTLTAESLVCTHPPAKAGSVTWASGGGGLGTSLGEDGNWRLDWTSHLGSEPQLPSSVTESTVPIG